MRIIGPKKPKRKPTAARYMAVAKSFFSKRGATPLDSLNRKTPTSTANNNVSDEIVSPLNVPSAKDSGKKIPISEKNAPNMAKTILECRFILGAFPC